jgi:hypothetical protein
MRKKNLPIENVIFSSQPFVMSNFSNFSKPLQELLGHLTPEETQSLLISTIVFTKTRYDSDGKLPTLHSASLPKISPFESLDESKLKIKEDALLIDMKAVEDLIATIDAIRLVASVLHLDVFDCIQIHRGGVVLLNFSIGDNHVGRMACVDIFNIRHHLGKVEEDCRAQSLMKNRDLLPIVVLATVAWMACSLIN